MKVFCGAILLALPVQGDAKEAPHFRISRHFFQTVQNPPTAIWMVLRKVKLIQFISKVRRSFCATLHNKGNVYLFAFLPQVNYFQVWHPRHHRPRVGLRQGGLNVMHGTGTLVGGTILGTGIVVFVAVGGTGLAAARLLVLLALPVIKIND